VTAIGVTRDILINGRHLRTGKYSLWVIPRPDIWTVIFSSAADVYHQLSPGPIITLP